MGSSRTTSAGDTCASSRPEIRFRLRARWRAANCLLDVDVAHVAEQLVAPLYYRVIVTGETVNAAFVDRIVEDFLRRRE